MYIYTVVYTTYFIKNQKAILPKSYEYAECFAGITMCFSVLQLKIKNITYIQITSYES